MISERNPLCSLVTVKQNQLGQGVFLTLQTKKKIKEIENRLRLSNITNETTVMSVLIKL